MDCALSSKSRERVTNAAAFGKIPPKNVVDRLYPRLETLSSLMESVTVSGFTSCVTPTLKVGGAVYFTTSYIVVFTGPMATLQIVKAWITTLQRRILKYE
jgi:hypothetical protein